MTSYRGLINKTAWVQFFGFAEIFVVSFSVKDKSGFVFKVGYGYFRSLMTSHVIGANAK